MDLTSEKIRLLERDAQWARAASEGTDLELILSFWTDDAIVIPPDQPAFTGKAALRRYMEATLQIPGFRITWTSSDVKFSPDAQMAYMFGRNSISMEASDGNRITNEGRAVTIWRREADGEWRCTVDIWNAGPAI
jgi:ketosteroid isomerase-like protein